MPLQPSAYDLANDEEFRLLFGASLPPIPAIITVVNASDYTCLAIAGEDSEITAVALDGWHYAADDLVYIMLAANSPDNAMIIGRPVGSHQLGIGTTTPAGPLHVKGDIGHFVQLQLLATSTAFPFLPDSTISHVVRGDIVVSDGTNYRTADLVIEKPSSGNNLQDVAAGGANEIRFRVYSTGSMNVLRISGSDDIKIVGYLNII